MRYFSLFPLVAALIGSPDLIADPLTDFQNELQHPTLSAEKRLALAESITEHTAWSAAMLAQYYYTGEGLNAPDKDRALAMFELSAQLGDAYSAYSAFLGHVQGWASQSDPAKASPYLWQAAKADIRQSRLYLADGYRTGNYGLPVSVQAAMQWAYSTEVPPEMHLDMCVQEDPLYQSRHCVTDWIEPAAEEGNPVASYLMGMQALHGIGMFQPDPKMAETWFSKAGDYGPALFARGDALYAEQGGSFFTDDDRKEMERLLLAAAQAGEPQAFTELAYVQMDKGDTESALELLNQADVIGACNSACKYQLSLLLEKSDPQKAARYLENAANEGDANALLESALKQDPNLPDTRAKIYYSAIFGNVTAMLWLQDRAVEAGDKERALIWRREAAAFQDQLSQHVLSRGDEQSGEYESFRYWDTRYLSFYQFDEEINILADSGRPEARKEIIEYIRHRGQKMKKRYIELLSKQDDPNYYLAHNRQFEKMYRVRSRAMSLSPWWVDNVSPNRPQKVAFSRDENSVPEQFEDGRVQLDGAWNPPEMLPFKLLANNLAVQQSHCGYLFSRETGDNLFIHYLKGGCRPDPVIQEHLQVEGAQKLVHNDAASAALLYDGSVVTWGGAMAGGSPILAASNFEDSAYSNLDDELKVYRRLQGNIIDIAPVQSHFLALENTGNILLWGPLAYYFDHEIKGDYQLLAASPDSDRFCALRRNGDVHCWSLGEGPALRIEANSMVSLAKVEDTFDTFAMLDEQGQLTLKSMVMQQDTDDLLPALDKKQRWKKLDQVIVFGHLRTLLVDTNDKPYYFKQNNGKLELKPLNTASRNILLATSPETARFI